ncbi:MAG TPA: SDR family oxidoreductase [Vicinamibacterales bacterium]|jgi:NAD(P)-dependent dehydrogenase (short-subunit alcohol dehydrogenase family)
MGTASPTSGGSAASNDLGSTVALVTGGSRGIGLAIVKALASRGARVALTGRDQKQLDAAAASSNKILALRADVTDPDQAARAIDTTAQKFGGLDVLVNNAGVGQFAHVAEMSLEAWRQVIDTNLSGVFYCSRAAIPQLRKRGGGWIINISSLAGKNPFVGGAAYCASKAGLNAFSEALMQEVRYDNIRVSYIMPGSVATGFSGRGASGEAAWKIAPEDIADLVVDLVTFPQRSLPSRIEIRPSRPQKA